MGVFFSSAPASFVVYYMMIYLCDQYILIYSIIWRYYYKCYCFYIFTIDFLFLSTQSFSLLFILFIDHHCFLSVCLSEVTISAFVFVCTRCWCFYACLGFKSISLSPCFVVIVCAFVYIYQCFCLILGYFWCRIAMV